MRAARVTAAALLGALLAAGPAQAQSDAKPSVLTRARQGMAAPSTAPRPDAAASLAALPDRAAFDRLARDFEPGAQQSQPHVLFVVDRADGNRVHFINTRRFALHADYLAARHLLPADGLPPSTYRSPARRFVLGTLSLHPQGSRWIYEFWQGDRLTAELLHLVQAALDRTVGFTPVAFKANAAQHEATAADAGLPVITQAELIRERPYLAYNTGTAVGRLRVVAALDGTTDIEPTDIVVLTEVPLALSPVAGVILAEPSTALSHVNLLAKGWGIPNVYLRDAQTELRALDGQWVRLQADGQRYRLTPATAAEARPAHRPTARVLKAPDLQRDALMPLASLRERDAGACGGKAARLGSLDALRRAGQLPAGTAPVPDGFCIPFSHYARFAAQPAVRARVDQALAALDQATSRGERRDLLAALRADLQRMPLPDGLAAQWQARWQQQLGKDGVFVRSSSNSEDLANFSGAGLYTTVPNVRQQLADAVLTVWASVWNAEAFEARRTAGLRHADVVMAAFVQRAVDSRTSGVMITRDPFDPSRRGVVYVSAKRGIGIKVVEGRRIAEQALFEQRSGSVERLSQSAESTELRLDANGGLVEQAASSSTVLSDEQVQALARLALAVQRGLGGGDQDIEWAIGGDGRLVLLQARPYVAAGR
ncbi:PEP/pyruvate-binding domain-containing protein [Pelomonas cellulosilytica]|uniref:Phosphoenolpyruvate synthase n=1 Tax=Pelomonas cellulosilytica TaxID=2906762 RepID=A0ABS8XZ98_9BURK|nr:PEP/pyruvate-binding domain-containing protein [Pelomonas sp. P8]MCE4556018.1 PEP/pyruvate-binding domain-containing protein [Pelomonas sp. P8]